MDEKKQKQTVDRKNYSFYMPTDFDNYLAKIQNSDSRVKPLSKSQAINFILYEIAQTGKFEIAYPEN